MAAVTLLCALALQTPAATATPVAAPKPGAEAPAFTLPSSVGKPHSLSEFRGKTVVLEWVNYDCPFVKKHYGAGNMQALQKVAAADGVVWLSICTSAPGKQGHFTNDEINRRIETLGAKPTAYLLDPEGKVGREYGAKTTPHLFVLDGEGKIRYMGGIDDKPTPDPADIPGARNYVREALAALKKGEAVAVATSRPYGCSVKYSD